MFVFKQKTAYGMRISDWSSDVCSSDLNALIDRHRAGVQRLHIGMVRSVAQHARDDAPLFGYPQALLVTKGLNIDRLSHARSLGPADTKGKSPRPYFRLQRPPRPLFTLGTLRTQARPDERRVGKECVIT